MKTKADRLSLHQLQTIFLIRRIYAYLLIIKYLQSLILKDQDGNFLSTSYLVHLNNGVYEDNNEDLDIKINGFPLKFERKYVSRNVPVGKVLGDACNISVAGGSGGGGGGRGGALSITPKTTIKNPFCGSDSADSQTQAYGWTSPLFSMVKEVDGGIAHFDGQGSAIFFEKDTTTGTLSPSTGAERYVAEEGVTITPISGGYKIKDKSGLSKTYSGDRLKRLTVIENEAGNRLTYDYTLDNKPTAIRDEAGNVVLSFIYNEFGYLSEVRAQDGRSVKYQTDSAGRLLRVEGLEGEVHTYEYESRNNSHLLKKKTDPEGREVFIEYKPGGLEVVKVTAFEGIVVQKFSYDFPNRVAYYTDPMGKRAKYDISKEGKLSALVLSDELLKKIETYENGKVEKTTDQYGNVYEVRYNERFDPIKITDPEGNVITIEYNQYWKISKMTDPLGHITTFEYNTKGQITAVNRPDGERVTFEYDGHGNIITATVTHGSKTAVYRYEYDSRGNITKVTDPMGNITRYGYDQYSHINRITDANGNIYKVTADTKGRPITIEDPLGNRWTLTYDSKDNIKTTTDAKGNTYTFTYDQKSRVTSVTDPMQNRTEYAYDPNGNLTTIKEAAGTQGEKITTATYDERNRITSITDPMGNMTQYSYAGSPGCPSCQTGGGSADIPAKIIDPLGNITLLNFDRAGKVTGIKDPMNNVTSFTYDPNGKMTRFTDANGYATKYQYDARGRIIKQTDANNGEITFTYDGRGNVSTLSDPNGNVTTFEYGSNDTMTKEIRPMGQITEYTYYSNGSLKTVKDVKGQISTYAYDSAGRLTDITYTDGKHNSATYDVVGNLTTYSNENVSGSITYDGLNRKTSETVNYGTFIKTFSYTYDSAGNKTSYTSPEGTTYSYGYNQNNQPSSIAFNGKMINLDYQWNRVTKETLPNGISTDFRYNANSWLEHIEAKQGTVPHLDKQYTFDNVGNISSITDTSVFTTNYSYDTTYQVTAATGLSSAEVFTYDMTGNRLTSTSSYQASAISYTHNANNEVLSAGTVTYQYDQNGNMIQKTDDANVIRYIYNAADRLERVELPGGGIAVYTYDPFGRRIKKDVGGYVTYYLYADEGLIGECDGYGNFRKSYGWMPDNIWGTNPVFMEEGGSHFFYHNDHLGTPQRITDGAGNVVWQASYSAFGEATIGVALVTNNLRFPGQYYDEETGNHYNWNRYYDPKTGRYTQVDPIGFEGRDENLYRYAKGTPLSFIDPDGNSVTGFREECESWLSCMNRCAKMMDLNFFEKNPVAEAALGNDFMDATNLINNFQHEAIKLGSMKAVERITEKLSENEVTTMVLSRTGWHRARLVFPFSHNELTMTQLEVPLKGWRRVQYTTWKFGKHIGKGALKFVKVFKIKNAWDAGTYAGCLFNCGG